MSPEILEEEKICNICQKPMSIRNPCGHCVVKTGQNGLGKTPGPNRVCLIPNNPILKKSESEASQFIPLCRRVGDARR
jgi:hypothetical protein